MRILFFAKSELFFNVTLAGLLIVSGVCYGQAETEETEPAPVTEPAQAAEKSGPAVEMGGAELNELGSATPGVPRKDDKTRIFSCSIYFPLNSVKYSAERVKECFNGINIERISYVHVIATATLSGSTDHNLYLSTRRAGALEGYIKLLYPEVQVHAFGGGENPKFGKSARIFIVESAEDPDKDKTGVEKVIVTKPEIRYQIKTEYIKEKKHGYDLDLVSGSSVYKPNSDSNMYQFMNVNVYQRMALPLIGETKIGMGYGIYRSNRILDIHTGSILAEKLYNVWKISKSHHLDLGVGLKAGMSRVEEESEADYGSDLKLRYNYDNLNASLQIGVSKHFNWLGVGGGVLL